MDGEVPTPGNAAHKRDCGHLRRRKVCARAQPFCSALRIQDLNTTDGMPDCAPFDHRSSL